MTREEHIERHKQLHGMLDELLADFLMHNLPGKRLGNTTLLELTEWSYRQTKDPAETRDTHEARVVLAVGPLPGREEPKEPKG